MDTKSWMKDILDFELPLYQITMPGSHDAGVYSGGTNSTFLGNKARTICQGGDFYYQCSEGSRFFDVRIKKAGNLLRAHHTTAGQGAYGGDLNTILTDIKKFLTEQSSEFVILRFSKCDSHDLIIEELKNTVQKELYNFGGCVAKHKIKAMKGKIIAIFDSGFDKHLADPKNGFLRFSKLADNAKSTEAKDGLATCGKYANKRNIGSVYANQIEHLHEHDDHTRDNHLFVLYWTQTNGKVAATIGKPFGKTSIKKYTESGAHQKIDDLVKHVTDLTKLTDLTDLTISPLTSLQNQTFSSIQLKHDRLVSGKPKPSLPNVVMYDFVNATTSQAIIKMNLPPFYLY